MGFCFVAMISLSRGLEEAAEEGNLKLIQERLPRALRNDPNAVHKALATVIICSFGDDDDDEEDRPIPPERTEACVKFLLSQGADPLFRGRKDDYSECVLVDASSCIGRPGNVRVVDMLLDALRGEPPSIKISKESVSLQEALNAALLRVVDTGNDREDEERAVYIIKKLLAAGADVNARDRILYTPLLHICDGGSGSLAVMKLLLEAGASIHVQAHDSDRTPLLCAAQFWPEAHKLLCAWLKEGAGTGSGGNEASVKSKNCAVCGSVAGKKCPCKAIRYCSEKCQYQDWKSHRITCSERQKNDKMKK